MRAKSTTLYTALLTLQTLRKPMKRTQFGLPEEEVLLNEKGGKHFL